MLEDEKTSGIITIGFGVNIYLPGGEINAKQHGDLTITKATLEIDGTIVVKDGKLMM